MSLDAIVETAFSHYPRGRENFRVSNCDTVNKLKNPLSPPLGHFTYFFGSHLFFFWKIDYTSTHFPHASHNSPSDTVYGISCQVCDRPDHFNLCILFIWFEPLKESIKNKNISPFQINVLKIKNMLLNVNVILHCTACIYSHLQVSEKEFFLQSLNYSIAH